MSRVLAGPWCAQLLADFGAEVIKIERPETGDDSRRWEPSIPSPVDPTKRASAYFFCANRGKKSLTLNLATSEGAQIVRRLVASSDVLIENYKAGDLARYDLGYEKLSQINPRLIHCSITGYGQTGPYSARAGYDTIMQAMGGLMSVTGERDDQVGGGPQRAGLPYIDLLTGVYSAVAILTALRSRDSTGMGQYIDLSLLDVQVSSLAYFGINYLATGRVPKRAGNTNPVMYPSGVFSCSDGEIVLLTGNDEQFARFCEALGVGHLAEDARYATNVLRLENSADLDVAIRSLLRAESTSHWVEVLSRVGVPCGPINDVGAVFSDPQVVAREIAHATFHEKFGSIPIVGNPIKLSKTPADYQCPPPMLGEHTADILGALGYDKSDIEELSRKQII